MKKLLRVSLLLGAVLGLWLISRAQAASPTGIIVSWDFRVYPACSATLTANCVLNFTFAMQFNNAPIGTPLTVALPATVSATAPTPIPCNNCIPAGTFTNWGTYLGCYTANYKDVNGIAQAGAVACITKQFPDQSAFSGLAWQ
jgi:hypothetical protein